MQVLPNHGLHAAGFIAAFLISLLLTVAALFFLARGRCLQGGMLSRCRVSLLPRDAKVGSGVR
jgi:ellis van creveld syndrome protein 2